MVQRQTKLFCLKIYDTLKDAYEQKHYRDSRWYTMDAAQRAGDEAVAAGAFCYDIVINRF